MGLSLLALSRCNSKPSDPLALMLKSETGCTLPCWLGIVPGLSSEIDFGKIAEANPDRFDDLKRNTFGLRFVQFIWRDRVMDGLMSSELEDDVCELPPKK